MHRGTLHHLRAAALVWCTLTCVPASAVLEGQCSIKNLARQCPRICVGEVLAVAPSFTVSQESAPRRTAEFRVDRVLKGTSVVGEVLSIILPQAPLDRSFNRSIERSPYQLLFLCSEPDGLHLCKDSANAAANSAVAVSRVAPAGDQRADPLEAIKREIVTSLDDPSPSVAANAADVLGEIGDSGAVNHLRPLLASTATGVAEHALVALVRLGDTPVLPRAVDYILAGSGTKSVRCAMYTAIENLRDPAVAQALYPILRLKDNVEAKRAVLLAFREMKSKTVLPEVQKLLDDPSWRVRHQAVMVMAATTGEYSYGPAIRLFQGDEGRYISHWKNWKPD